MEDRGGGQGTAENLPAGSRAVDDDEDGFNFPVPPPLAPDACIVPVYPIFGRPLSPPPPGAEDDDEPETATLRVPLGRLLLEEREFRARQQDGRSIPTRAPQHEEDEDGADADEELEGVAPETYCLWAPGVGSAPASQRRCRKSGSTGSVLRWRRISERLVGRSHSDGKEKFVFLHAPATEPPPPPPPNKEEEGGAGNSKAVGDRGAGQRWSYYGQRGGRGGGRKRSYLPYRQELVGLFANVSGLRRSYHPF